MVGSDVARSRSKTARGASLAGSTALALLAAAGVATMSGEAFAQALVVDDQRVIDAESIAGINVTESGILDGTNLTITQSSNNYGLLVTGGQGTLTDGSITQANADGSAQGVRVEAGSANVNGTTINASGKNTVSGIYTTGDNSTATVSGITVDLSATGSSTGSPSAALHAVSGSMISSIDGIYSTSGNYAYGILAAGDGTEVTSTGDTISTSGAFGWGVFAFSAYDGTANTQIGISDASIQTSGDYGYALLAQEAGAVIDASGLEIVTEGEWGLGAYAAYGGEINIEDSTIQTRNERGIGLYSAGAEGTSSSIGATNVDITTEGLRANGVNSYSDGTGTASIVLNGGSITTANSKGNMTQDGDGARSYALYATGDGASIDASNLDITTLGQRSYGAYAINKGTIDLENVNIETSGFMAYGIYASGEGSAINATNVNITTRGNVGDAAWAYAGGELDITGGSFNVLGGDDSAGGEVSNGLVAVGGTDDVAGGVIRATELDIVTTGRNSVGLKAGAPIGAALTSGEIYFSNGTVHVSGEGARAATAGHGSKLVITDSVLTSERAEGIVLYDDATVTVDGTTIVAEKETFVSNLNRAGKTQTISVTGDSVATQNNGTLLLVNRSDDGADGVVQLTLGTDTVTAGDILDEGDKDDGGLGGTDVTLETGASWTGIMRGVRNFLGGAGGDVVFEEVADIEGDLSGDSTSFTFSPLGGNIGGDVNLDNQSSTTGGSKDSPILVGGNVNVDDTSTLGGNWNIDGTLSSNGIISPGNSIGVITTTDLILGPTSIFAVDINSVGDSDLTAVINTATLDGTVLVRTDEGIRLDSPYVFLTAGNPIVTQFDTAEFERDTAFLDAELTHNPNNVELTISRNGVDFADAAESANQAAVANALESLDIEGPVMTEVALSSFAEASNAFAQLSGEIHASVLTGLVEDSQAVRDAANARIRAAFDGVGGSGSDLLYADPAATAGPGMAVWASAYGWRASTDATSNSAKIKRDSAGFLVGADGGLGDWRVGALAGYSQSSLDADALASSAEADHIHLGIYGGGQRGAVGVRTGMAYSWSDIDTSRHVTFMPGPETLTGSYKAGTFQVFGELGYRVDVETASFEPFVNLAHVRTRADAFRETGGAAALDTAKSTVNTTFTTLGVRASTELGAASLHAMLGWRHAAGDIRPNVLHSIDGSDVFSISGAPIARNAAMVEAGVNFGITDAASLDISYAGQFGSGTEQHGVKSVLSFGF